MISNRTSTRSRQVLQTLALVTLLCLTLQATATSASPSAPTLVLGYVEITNVRETSFTISWITDHPSNGVARCYNAGGDPIANGVDPLTDTSVHYVLLTGFSPSTAYRCEVESGGVVNDNDGAFYPVTTGGTLPIPPAGGTVYGRVFLNDGVTPANGSIVYLRLIDADGAGSPGHSQWVSSQVTQGYWFLDLYGIRTANATAYFVATPGDDQLEYWAQGGLEGTWGRPVLPDALTPVPPPGPMPDIVLQPPPLAVTLTSFSALSQQDGVLVAWETASEVDNQGFNLYRSEDPAGPQDLVAFVPSQAPGSAQGFAYEWLDSNVVSGQTYYYWLESIDLAGATTMHGPVSATYGAPTAVDLAAFTAQPMDNSALLPLLLILLGVAAYGLHHGLRRRITIQ